MTLRAVIIGLAGALFIAAFGYVNDWVLGLESFTSGHLLPVIVLGLTFLAVVLLNPLLFRLRRSWALRPAELGLVVILLAASCSIPGRGLMEQCIQIFVMPIHWNQVTPGWKEHKTLDYAPKQTMVDNYNHDDVITRFVTGSAQPEDPESLLQSTRRKLGQVPWRAWKPPLWTWLPLIFLSAICSISLALVLHRQWSEHESLSYPIADFTASLIDRESGRPLGAIYRSRLFWLGLGIVLTIRVNNGLCAWFPKYLVPVQMGYSFAPLAELWPSIGKAPYGWSLLHLRIFPLAIAFAFFLSSEISLTLGLTQILWVALAIPMVTYGINLSTDYGIGGWCGWQRAGSYVALGLMLLYTGRHYYWDVLVRSLAVWRRDNAGRGNVWACRVFLASLVALVVLITRLGMEWPFSLATVLLMLLTFVMVSRISAETGLFFVHPRWQPFGVLLGLCGGYALGPKALAVSGLVCMVLCIDPSQALMPYFVNGLKIAEKLKLKPVKVAGMTCGMYVAGVILATVVIIAVSYDIGPPSNATWSFRRIPSMTFQAVNSETLQLEAMGSLEDSMEQPWFRRVGRITPKKNFLWAAGVGFGLVILFSILRLRLPWWPLHPVMFLLWATYPMMVFSHSFLIGWMVKKAVVRYGGQKMVKKLKPFAIGVIAGEILGALCFMIAGAVYNAHTGLPPIRYRYFPR